MTQTRSSAIRLTRLPHITRRQTLAALAAASLCGWTLPAAAWTDKPVRLLVPAPAGGTMDVLARILSDQLATDLKVPVIVDNKPGAGGAIAAQALKSAPPDGQTLMITASNVLTEIPHVLKTSLDPLKDVKAVAAMARSSLVLVGAPGFPADFKGLVGQLKASPGKYSFASYSAGTSSHYAGLILNQKAGLDLVHVPFPGSPPALQQLMGGQIAIMFDGMVTSLPLVRSGKVHPYAVASRTRSRHFPDVPTMTELGYADIEFSNWLGVVAVAGMPAELIDKINASVQKAAAEPKVRDRLLAAGFEIEPPHSAAELQKSVQTEHARNAGIVKAFNIQPNQ